MDQLPQWIDFEMEQQPEFNVAPLFNALKQRRMRAGSTGTAAAGAINNPNDEVSYSDILKGPQQKGVKSL